MANWCSNTVVFTGEQNQLDNLRDLFEGLAEKQRIENKGQLPAFITGDDGYFFDLSWELDVLYYETRWSPNTENVVQIADLFGVGFIHSYSEQGNGVYGEATYESGDLTDVYLDMDDLGLYTYDELNDTYLFEDETYECSEDILDIMLERKKAIQTLQQ